MTQFDKEPVDKERAMWLQSQGLREDDPIGTLTGEEQVVTEEGFRIADIERADKFNAPFSEESEASPPDPERYTRFRDEIEVVINSHSMEGGSDTPDFMLAEFLTDALMSFDRLMQRRDMWYGASHRQLQAQIEAEGAHTAAGQAEIERMQRVLDRYLR